MQFSIDLPRGSLPAARGGQPVAPHAVAASGWAGFNEAFSGANRSERIFAHHLRRLGIRRLLDVGSNTGQFATKLRRLGFDGAIYSVEPQASAHAGLLAAARHDPLWFPLARQAAGAKRQAADLRLSENGWSSSLLDVHANHVRAEHTARCIGQEAIVVNEAGRLLHAGLMPRIEALKIDVQGYEDRVLDGYLPYLGQVRLLLLELSAVECYEGGADMFALDERLVARHGFARVALEPSYYDDTRGVVQQYDGIYHRPDAPADGDSGRVGVRVDTVLTSIGAMRPRSAGADADGETEYLERCRRSWSALGGRVASIAETPPPDSGIEWIETASRPSLAEMLAAAPDRHLLLTNADILFTAAFADLLPRLDPAGVYYGHRLDIDVTPAGGFSAVAVGEYPHGFDYFLLPPGFVRKLVADKLLPVELRIGEPWWDYLLPVLALAYGFPLKKLSAAPPLALHRRHATNYSPDVWLGNGAVFMRCLERLLHDPGSNATSLLAELTLQTGDRTHDLHRLSRLICQGMP